MTEKELKVLFENNSNCYTEVLTDDGEFQEMAITFDVFVSLVKILNIPVVIDTVCCENCVNFCSETKTCDETCIEYSEFKQQTGL